MDGTERNKLRRAQDVVVRWCQAHGMTDTYHLTADNPTSPQIWQLKQYLYPDWSVTIYAMATRIKERRSSARAEGRT